MTTDNLKATIESAWENRASISPQNADPALKSAVHNVIEQLDKGALRVAEKFDGEWAWMR